MDKIKNSIDEVIESITLQDIVDDYNEMKYKNSLLELKRRRIMKTTYMDYSATTYVKEVLDAMMPFFKKSSVTHHHSMNIKRNKNGSR